MALLTESTATHANGFVRHQRDELLHALDRIDAEGWDGATATTLLQTVRVDVVRSLVRIAGLHGPVASQAEATGWAIAWETLRRPSLRRAESPWGILWVAVRRAVFGEHLAAKHVTSARTAYRLCSSTPLREAQPVASLDALTTEGSERFAVELHPAQSAGLLDQLADAFARAGWPDGLARRLVHQIAVTAERPRPQDAVSGWRHLAVELGIQPSQARRAMVLILGSANCAGLADIPVARWLSPRELGRAVRLAYDPEVGRLDEPGARRPDTESGAVVGPMAIEESWDRLRTETSWQAVFWVTEWPRMPSRVDFLAPVLAAPGVRRSVSLLIEPVSLGRALRDVRRARVGHAADAAQRARLGRLEEESVAAEVDDVTRRELDLVAGHGDLRFTGLVTVAAATREDLDGACSVVETTAAQAMCELRRLSGQQVAAHTATAMPLAAPVLR